MAAWSTKQESMLPKVLARLERKGQGVPAFMITLTTTATAHRSAAENYKVLAIQRAAGRDPWFVAADERRDMLAQFRAEMSKAESLGPLERMAHAFGRSIVEFYRSHVAGGRNARGEMPPDRPSTLKRKAKQGRGSLTLVDTRQLLESISYQVKAI
jgi:hypothetical protein